MKKRFITDIKAGDMVDDIFVLAEKILSQKRDGNNFLNVTLSDKTGTVKGRVALHDAVNVILQNLFFEGVAGDVISVSGSHHIWIDHCDIINGVDGNLEITHGSHWITVSWTRFGYTDWIDTTDSGRRSCLVSGSSDHGESDEGRMNTTWHHNWFTERVRTYMPRLLFGKSHIYNSYYTSEDNIYCVGAGSFAGVLIENNYFDGVNSPHQFVDSNPAHITARNNRYEGTSGSQDTGSEGDVAPFPDDAYPYELDDPDILPELIPRCVGPQDE